jgi:beta-mannanase
MQVATDFEQAVSGGKTMSIIHFGQPWFDCSTSPCTPYTFPYGPMNNIRAAGAIPMLSWSSQSMQSGVTDPQFTLAKIINGDYDSFITQFAEAAKSWGHPFFLRFDWEMNGTWFPWSEGVNGNTAGQFVQMWRHVHDIFTAVGATNVTWVWCPNVSQSPANLAELYPGHGYVDWTGLDGYNYGPAGPDGSSYTGQGATWSTFDQLFRGSYDALAAMAPTKPIMIGETASVVDGGSKAQWLTDMLNELSSPTYAQVGALVYYDRVDGSYNWPLTSSTSAAQAFAAGIQSPAYQAGTYGGLGAGPIPAPGA